MIGDLHCHTRLSDGSSNIEDLVFYAKRGGLDFVAITDHDTMAGATRAGVLGQRYGIGVIPGVELSTWDGQRGRKVHILCYLPEKPNRLLGLCTKVLQSRTQAGQEMVKKLMTYYPVTAEHIARHTSGSKSIYKAHMMHALMDLGYIEKVYDPLYHTLFNSKDGLCYVPVEYPEVRTAIDVIHSAGGVAVMAHPADYDSFDLLEELAGKGVLDGAEVYHPRCSEEDQATLTQMAQQFDLIVTGGTDYHGYYTSTPNPIGTQLTMQSELDKLFAFKGKAK